MEKDADEKELWEQLQNELGDDNIDAILEEIGAELAEPVKANEVTMRRLMEEYPKRSHSTLRLMMMRMVEEGRYNTRIAWDEEKHRRIRVWWKKEPES